MARIRTIKPEFFEDEKIAKLSLRARLLFIGTWNVADDAGVCRANPVYLRSKLFAYDEISPKEIAQAVDELVRQKLILVMTYGGEMLLLVKNWPKHQKINKPSQFKVLSKTYEENLALFTEHSGSTPVVLPEDSRQDLGTGSGKGKGAGTGRGVSAPTSAAPPQANALLAVYCEGWKRAYKSPKSPPIGPKEIAALKRMISQHGQERMVHLTEAYLRMPDKWFLTKTHDIPTLESNLGKVALYADKGTMLTQADLKNIEAKVSETNLIDAIERGEI